MDELIEKAKMYIKNAFMNTDKAHDYLHSLRVYQNAINILNKTDAEVNEEVVLLAALLHDIDDRKLFANGCLLDKWFEDNPTKFENDIRIVISEVSFSKGIFASTIESMVVQDADRLDAIGAIGIARVFTYGGAIGRPIYSEDGQSSLGHFDEKLFKIKGKMNTPAGKAIAEGREQYLKQFVTEFWKEISGDL